MGRGGLRAVTPDGGRTARAFRERGRVGQGRGARNLLPRPWSSVPLLGRRLLGRMERSEEHTSELQSLMRISYAVFCLNKKTHYNPYTSNSAPYTTTQYTHNYLTTHSAFEHQSP